VWGVRIAIVATPIFMAASLAKPAVASGLWVQHASVIYLTSLLGALLVSVVNLVFPLLRQGENTA
jgi:hypothetical protein